MIKKQFNRGDKDKNGYISYDEVTSVLKKEGNVYDANMESLVRRLFRFYDVDEDNYLSLAEYAEFVKDST